jgi:transposase
MRAGIDFTVSPEDRRRLEAVVRDCNRPQKHVWRARIILLTAEGLGTNRIVRETGKDKTAVWRWQERFMHEGVDGLLGDKTRPPGKPPLPEATVARVLELTGTDPPDEATHWTATAMAKGIDEEMAFFAFDLLAREIARRVDARPPFSALFTLWLSITAALGEASQPSRSRVMR